MAKPMVMQAIADDQKTVATSVQTLMANMDLDSNNVIDTEIVSFGAQKFLIVITFIGSWTWRTAGGLASVVSRSLAMSRSTLPLLGLKPSIARLIKIRRGLSPLTGVAVVAERAFAVKLSFSSLAGLVSAAVDTVFNNHNPSPSLGLSLSEDETLAMARSGSPKAGLAVDVGYSLVSP